MADLPPEPGKKIVAVPLDEARRARGEALVALPRSKVASLRAFRRVRADRFFGALGAILVVIGIILIFTWPKPPTKPPPTFDIEWPETTWDLGTKSDEIRVTGGPANPAFQPKSHPFKVDQPNATRVTFWVSWKDDVGDEGAESDQIEVEVKGPSNTNVSFKENRSFLEGNISYTLLLSGIPDVASTPAKTEAEARAKLGDRSNATGQGDWTLIVRILKVGNDWNPQYEPLRDSVPCQAPYCTPDTGNRYTYHFEFGTYNATLKKHV